jgi:hypothetical protein
LRLLLDEHFSKRIAAEMRDRGYDVVAVTERDELRGLPDAQVFAEAASARYVIVTQNYADFALLVGEAALGDIEQPGVVFVPKRLWSSIRDLDGFVEALCRFLEAHAGAERVPGTVAWLE